MQLLFSFAATMPDDRPLRTRRKRPLPPRHKWPRAKQPITARRPCEVCGELDRAVSTRDTITYYGPARCEVCGTARNLRKVERPPDWAVMRELYLFEH